MKDRKQLKNIYVDVNLQLGVDVILPKDISNRLKKVMRLKKGWQFAIFNGKDGLFLAQIETSECDYVKLLEKIEDQPLKSNTTLFLPILKKEALSNAVRQATEMKIDNIQMIITDHMVEKVSSFKAERYNTIILNASEQSERLSLVNLKEPIPMFDAITEFKDEIFWAYERLSDDYDNTTSHNFKGVLIGPEGGFSDDEVAQLKVTKNAVAQTLTTAILKADTAVVVALAKSNMLT